MSSRTTSVWFRDPAREGTTETRQSTSRATQERETRDASERRKQDEEDEEDDSEDIIMAIDQKGPKIGCAYYTAADETLSFMEDIEFPSVDCIDARGFDGAVVIDSAR